MSDPIPTSLPVTVGEEKFEFKIPDAHGEIAIGERMRKIRRQVDPTWDGFEQGLDGNTQFLLRACATFELFLKASSTTWAMTADAKGAPVCDSSKFPPDKINIVVDAYQGFTQALSTFRENGAKPQRPAS